MNSDDYEIPLECTGTPLSGPLEAAEEALLRLDERLRKHPLAAGWAARQHFREACASMGLEGELVHLEDVVLRDSSMDIRTPTPEDDRAMACLRGRRQIAAHGIGWPLSEEGLTVLRGRARRNLQISPLLHDPDWNEEERLSDWRSVLRQTYTLPALLAAAVAYDAWLQINPFVGDDWLGRQFIASDLQRRGKAKHHLPALSIGLRQLRMPGWERQSTLQRIITILKGFEAASTLGLKELERLVLAREVMETRLKGRRSSSYLPHLIDLVLELPLITVPLAAKRLRVSDQAASMMVKQLTGSLREITDRKRYRAWGIL